MPPKKKAKHAPPGNNDDQPTQQSSQSNHGVGGHAAQLQKAGELVMAPTRQGKANDNIEINELEENPMAPSQLMKAKKKATNTEKSVEANTLQSDSQHAHSLCPHFHEACLSERFGFKLPQQDLIQPGHSYNKTREEATQHSSNHNQLKNSTHANYTEYDEDLFRSAEDSKEDEDDPAFNDTFSVNRDDDDDTLMELGQDNNEDDSPDVFNVLEHHHAKNRQHKAPSPTRPSNIPIYMLIRSLLANIHLDMCLVADHSRMHVLHPLIWSLLSVPLKLHHLKSVLLMYNLSIILPLSLSLQMQMDLMVPLMDCLLIIQHFPPVTYSPPLREKSWMQYYGSITLKKIKIEKGYFPEYSAQMSHLQWQKALKLTNEFQCLILINGLILMAVVMKGVITGFHDTGTDKVPDLSTNKCRSNFNAIQKSVDKLMENPEHHQELDKMLEEWAEYGMMDELQDDSDSTSGSEDVNIIM
ncbi:hypothetical protein BDR05DRAFT_952053 [Suillus weaverae]|nr:hypothetical protein BDR05DRAFT_952053 [Suillus weaverae]